MALQRGHAHFLDFNLEFDLLSRSWWPPKGNQVLEMYRAGYTRLYADEYGGELRLPQDVFGDVQERAYTEGIRRINVLLDDMDRVYKGEEGEEGESKVGEVVEGSKVGEATARLAKDDDVLLCPGTVMAYALRHRVWGMSSCLLRESIANTLQPSSTSVYSNP